MNPDFHLRLDGYVYFAQKQRQKIKEDNPRASTADILSTIRLLWSELADEDKIDMNEKSDYIMDQMSARWANTDD